MPENFSGETTFVESGTLRNLTMRSLYKQEKPFAFLKHQNFLDFDEAGLDFPIYMNFVRHPVERIISWYYYVRAPWYLLEEDSYNNTVLKVITHGGKKSLSGAV